jgi:MFS family permease
MFIFAFFSSFANDFIELLIIRSLYGATNGFFSPLNFTILGEITPKKNRGAFMTLIGLFYVLGELFCCLVAYFTTDNLNFTTGNWRGLLMSSSFLALICFILLLL